MKNLAKEIGNVPDLPLFDLRATEYPATIPGRGLVRTMIQPALFSEVRGHPLGRLLARIGLLALELVILGGILKSKVEEADEKEFDLASAQEEIKVKEALLKDAREEAARTASQLKSSEAQASGYALKCSKFEKELKRNQASEAKLKEELVEARREIEDLCATLDAERAASNPSDVIADYKSSEQFQDFLVDEISPYYSCGRNHILRMVAADGIPPSKLFSWASAPTFGEAARSQHKMIQFQPMELDSYAEEVKAVLQDPWVPDFPLPNYLSVLLARFDDGEVVTYEEEPLADPVIAQPLPEETPFFVEPTASVVEQNAEPAWNPSLPASDQANVDTIGTPCGEDN